MPKAKKAATPKTKITVFKLELQTDLGILNINQGGYVDWDGDSPDNATPDQWIAIMTYVKKVMSLIEVG